MRFLIRLEAHPGYEKPEQNAWAMSELYRRLDYWLRHEYPFEDWGVSTTIIAGHEDSQEEALYNASQPWATRP